VAVLTSFFWQGLCGTKEKQVDDSRLGELKAMENQTTKTMNM